MTAFAAGLREGIVAGGAGASHRAAVPVLPAPSSRRSPPGVSLTPGTARGMDAT